MSTTTFGQLSHRDRAILRAVSAGGAELLHSEQPDLILDGRFCCDQAAVRQLANAGLIGQAGRGTAGQRVPAVLTAAGRSVLAACHGNGS